MIDKKMNKFGEERDIRIKQQMDIMSAEIVSGITDTLAKFQTNMITQQQNQVQCSPAVHYGMIPPSPTNQNKNCSSDIYGTYSSSKMNLIQHQQRVDSNQNAEAKE